MFMSPHILSDPQHIRTRGLYARLCPLLEMPGFLLL